MFPQQEAGDNDFCAAGFLKQGRSIASRSTRPQYSADSETTWKRLADGPPPGAGYGGGGAIRMSNIEEGPPLLIGRSNPPGIPRANPSTRGSTARYSKHWMGSRPGGDQACSGGSPMGSIDPYRLSPLQGTAAKLSPYATGALAPACYRVFPATSHVSPMVPTNHPTTHHWPPKLSSPLRPWNTGTQQQCSSPTSRLAAAAEARPLLTLEPQPQSVGTPRDPRHAQKIFAMELQRRIASRHSLLPDCVDREADESNVSAYTVVAFPTTMAYIEAMGILLRKIIDVIHPRHRLEKQFRFDAVSVPIVGIAEYLERLRCFFLCSPECFVLAMIYIDRLVRLYDGRVVLCSFNIHRILVTAVMVAAKFFDDVYYSNSFYAKIGGLSLEEMNVLESHFLHLIKYDLFVSPREYERYRHNVSLLHSSTPRSSQTPAQPDKQLSSSSPTPSKTTAATSSPSRSHNTPTDKPQHAPPAWPGGPLFEETEVLAPPQTVVSAAAATKGDGRDCKRRVCLRGSEDLLVSTSSTQCSTPSDNNEYNSPAC